MSKKSKLKSRPKNICVCGKKMGKTYDHCEFCEGKEYYECPDWKNCGRIYELNGEEI